MLFLFLLPLLVPLEGRFTNSPRSHLSDSLKLKCDALPYRTNHVGTRCFFAITQEIKYEDAPAKCSAVFAGSNVAPDAPTSVFESMMIEKSKFHVDKDDSGNAVKPSGAKQVICVYDSGYTCDSGTQSSVIPGKCLHYNAMKMSYISAVKFCPRQNMELPTVRNDLDNQMVREAFMKEPVWVINEYKQGDGKWVWWRSGSYARHSTCDWVGGYRPRLWAGSQMAGICNWQTSSAVDRTGYWGNGGIGPDYSLEVLCVKDADNDFTGGKKGCVANHEFDPETGRCEWTGPAGTAVKFVDNQNRTYFMPMPDYPKNTYMEIDIYHTKTMTPWDNNVVKLVVRRGCMFTGYAHPLGDLISGQDWILVGNKVYGEWNVPSSHTGEVPWAAGLTRCLLFCGADSAVNDYVPVPPPKKKCIEHHVFNEATQICEWKHDHKYCAELITHDNRRKMIEIPKWPFNRKYDFEHWGNETIRKEDFHVTITDIIVRQNCWATLYWGRIDQLQTLPTSGYGKYQVKSFYNGLVNALHDGTHRVVCECID